MSSLYPETHPEPHLANAGIVLDLDSSDSRIEQLREYKTWTLLELNELSGLTEFCDIMCAVEWLDHTLQTDLDELIVSLEDQYDLGCITIAEFLEEVGVPSAMLEGERMQRTVPEFVQTAFNAFRLQEEYQDDPASTDSLIAALCEFAAEKGITTLVEPKPLCEKLVSLQSALAKQGQTEGEIVGQSFTVKYAPDQIAVTETGKTRRHTVVCVSEADTYVCGLNPTQMQQLETTVAKSVQAITPKAQVKGRATQAER